MKKFINITLVLLLLFVGDGSAQTQYQVVKLMVTGKQLSYKEDSLYDCHYVVRVSKKKIVIGGDVYIVDSSYKMDAKETEYYCHLGKKFAAVFVDYPIQAGSIPGELWWRANSAVNIIIDDKIFYYSANKIRSHLHVGK